MYQYSPIVYDNMVIHLGLNYLQNLHKLENNQQTAKY